MIAGKRYRNIHGGEILIYRHAQINKIGRTSVPMFVFDYEDGQRKEGAINIKSKEFTNNLQNGLWEAL